jgi:thiol-disulfide isomerase/thioredoxin
LLAGRVDSIGDEISVALPLAVEGELPSLAGATQWLNSGPLSVSQLRGRPVVVNFWTYSCINWIRQLPYVRAWAHKYDSDGLVVVGVHTPEFGFEHEIENIRRAATEMQVHYPIAVDSNYTIWRAFSNEYWPALYFADAEGRIRHHRFGEGDYERSELVIRQLLEDAGIQGLGDGSVAVDAGAIEAAADWDTLESPETYIGYARAENLVSPGGAVIDRPNSYARPPELARNSWALLGDWTVERESALLNGAEGGIAYRFRARDLNLVLGPPAGADSVRFRVLLDGESPGAAHGVDSDEQGNGSLAQPRLYQLIRQPGAVAERTFEIVFLDPGARAYVFTFG